MSLRDRLARLEKNRPVPRSRVPDRAGPVYEKDDLFFHQEQWRRAVEGRELLPTFVHTVEDQKCDAEKTLSDTIPWLESTPGWSGAEGQDLIEHWRAEAEQTIEDYHAGRLEETDSTRMMIERDFGGTLPKPANDTHDREDNEE